MTDKEKIEILNRENELLKQKLELSTIGKFEKLQKETENRLNELKEYKENYEKLISETNELKTILYDELNNIIQNGL